MSIQKFGIEAMTRKLVREFIKGSASTEAIMAAGYPARVAAIWYIAEFEEMVDAENPEIFAEIYYRNQLFVGTYLAKAITSEDGKHVVPLSSLYPEFDVNDPDMLGYRNKRVAVIEAIRTAIELHFDECVNSLRQNKALNATNY